MKKIFALLICFVVVLTLFTIPCFAEDVSDTASENASVADGENIAQEDAKNFYDEFIAEISSVANWAELGVLLTGIIALIAAVRKCVKPISTAVSTVVDWMHNKSAKREDVEKAVTNAVCAVRDEYRVERENLIQRYDAIQQSQDRLTTIVVLAFTHMKINPTAKAEIMNMITGAKQASGNVYEDITKIEAAIAEAYASEEKIPTPALDSITKDVAETANSDKADADPVYIPLGG